MVMRTYQSVRKKKTELSSAFFMPGQYIHHILLYHLFLNKYTS